MPPIKKKEKPVVESEVVEDVVSTSDDIYEQIKGVIPRKDPKDYVSTGITLLNLALSNNKDAGYERGQIVHISGNKHAGKTFFGQTFLAASCYSENTKEDEKHFIDAEKSDNFDHSNLYGSAYDEQVSDIFDIDDIYTLEAFYDKAVNLCSKDKSVLMVLDSHTALISELELKIFEENAELREKEKDVKSDYISMKNGQVNSLGLRRLSPELSRNKGVILFLTQVRSNTDGGQYAPKFKSTTGGNSLPHYEQYAFTLSVKKSIDAMDFKKQEQQIGNIVEVSITKNKGTGKQCKLEIPVYKDYGIDDLGANLNYLRTYNVVRGPTSATLISPFSPKDENNKYIKMSLKELTKYIEENNLEEAVRTEVEKTWLQSELSVALGRKKRFGC